MSTTLDALTELFSNMGISETATAAFAVMSLNDPGALARGRWKLLRRYVLIVAVLAMMRNSEFSHTEHYQRQRIRRTYFRSMLYGPPRMGPINNVFRIMTDQRRRVKRNHAWVES